MSKHIRLRTFQKQNADLRKLARALLALVEHRQPTQDADRSGRSEPRGNREAEP